MKKKILALCLVLALAVTAIGGATLAYFTDTDAQTNVFTIGNVKIDLFEDFNTENLPLMPGVGTVDPVTGVREINNTIEKEVYVENTGNQPTYVRVHIAVPAFTRDGSNINVIETLRNDMTTVDGKWIWGTTLDANYPYRDGGAWNMYRDITIQGVPYKVFVATYETVLQPGEVTVDAIDKVYMDPNTTQEEIAAWNAAYADEYGSPIWPRIYVVAEAVQEDGFSDAITALNTAFGVPGTYDVDFLAAAENKTFVETTSQNGK